ncbi:MAG TPA: acyl carrier protein [Candidatus Absconditabacterales bacterium]|nr:acyl carrier protein [Candidatus Absconditabacterales bacterium]
MEKQKEVFPQLKNIIVDKLGITESEVTKGASFSNDLGADSLDFVELIMEVENEFNVRVYSEFEYALTTVGDMEKYIRNYLSDNKKNYHEFKEKLIL